MRETRLRWFGRVQRRNANAPVRRREIIYVLVCKIGKGWPKKSWNKVIKYDSKFIRPMKDMAYDRSL